MTMRRAVLLAASAVIALAGCEPLRETDDAAAGATRSQPTDMVTRSPSPAPSMAPTRKIASRDGGRSLSPEQFAAMYQARTSVSDGEIMRQLANTAERIAARMAAGESAPPPASIHPGTNRALGYRLMIEFGWGPEQWPALDALWYRESGWNHLAENRSSGAYGIPQSLPASKMATVGPDWKTNPETQIRWGLAYIGARYGSPKAAWQHSEDVGWY